MAARNKMPIAVELYYFAHEVEGHDKKRPPVILIHGAGGNHLSWPPQIRRMAERRIGINRRVAIERALARADKRGDLREKSL